MSHIERKTFYSTAECGGDCDAMYARVNVVTKLRMNAEISKIQVKIEFSIQFGLRIMPNNDAIDTQKVHKNGFQRCCFSIFCFAKLSCNQEIITNIDYSHFRAEKNKNTHIVSPYDRPVFFWRTN